MTLHVKLFGMLKSLVGDQTDVTVALTDGNQVRDLIVLFQAQYPKIGELLLNKKVIVSINHEIAHPETTISSTDEIAFLPPFAGGSGQLRST
ncbi:MAG: molybdopterin synthase sulfur carrier subunit [Nitrospirales bacterium]|nr:molybdopterin synthase sulfur carrier subunit [Nitrospirales bacterium]